MRSQGHQVSTGGQILAPGAYTAGDALARARELNDAYADDTVRAIVACIGGYNSNGLLRHLDYDLIAAHPKPLIGYSDVTALLIAVYCRTGQVTYHGPTLMPELAEWPQPFHETAEWFAAALQARAGAWDYAAPGEWTDEFLLWGAEDKQPRTMHAQTGWTEVRPGHGEGVLFGGNLDTLCALLGTQFLTPPAQSLFFWETTQTELAVIDRALTQIEDAGLLDGARGMVVGKTFRSEAHTEDALISHLGERYSDWPWPIVARADIGHTDPMITVPIGRRGALDGAHLRVLAQTDGTPPSAQSATGESTADSNQQGRP